MTYTRDRAWRVLPRFALGACLTLALTACETGELLEVEDPDIVTPGSLTGEIGLSAIYAGAIGDVTVAYDGGAGDGSFLTGYVTASASLSDEAYVSGTFPSREQFDQRAIDLRNGNLLDLFQRLQRARRAAEVGAERLLESDPEDVRAAELQALAGYTYVALGEGFCSGVPFSTATLGGELEYGPPNTTEEVFNIALARFQAAEAQAGDNEEIANLARVGQGRALLNLGQYTEAAAAVAEVPDDYLYTLFHSTSSARQENGFYAANTVTQRLSIADDQGGSGPPFRDGSDDGEGLSFLSADDPRVSFTVDTLAFDATVDSTYLLLNYGAGGLVNIPLGRSAPAPLATGIEARLIEAEAALGSGNPGGALAILNDLRATADLDPLDGPVTVQTLFEERAFWLYATGHRLGDLRRLIRQYGQSPENVFPTGDYFKGGEFGTDVNFPIPQLEVNNPEAQGCLNRSA
ncbi:MAG TPA: RagB/SusD family nutrient uptake outer membrane protein [Longimicrobiaceae bacterium]|nr:RagB/SusD family nutrient uptake outer membrane protein [Longimicrobiaceae bacterium]